MTTESGLPYEEHNGHRDITLIYIHGALASSHEFSLVVPHLQQYHILVPSLHVVQAGAKGFVLAEIRDAVADLIKRRAKGGKAHVFGLSMGGHVTLALLQKYPELAYSAIVSGVPRLSELPAWKQFAIPYVLYTQSILPARILPKETYVNMIMRTVTPADRKWAEELQTEPVVGSMALCREVANTLSTSLGNLEDLSIGVKTLVIAGTLSAQYKFPDPVPEAEDLVRQLKKWNADSAGITIPSGSHPWPIQVPELCASVVDSWINGTAMPAGAVVMLGFEPLTDRPGR